MNADPSRSGPESAAAAGTTADADGPPPMTAIPATTAPRLPLWLLGLGIGLLSGLISWAGGEAIRSAFRVDDEVVYPANYKSVGGFKREAMASKIRGEALQVVERKRAAASFGLLGLFLSAGLGLIGAWAAGWSRTAVVGGVAGGLAGAAAGVALSWVAVPLFFRFQDPDSGLLVLFLTHAAIFIGVGAAAGLALGLGLGDRLALGRAIFGGMLGGFVGTMALEIVNSLAFPLMRTFEPIASEWPSRGVMFACAALGPALGCGLAAGRRPWRSAPATAGWRPSPPAVDL